MQDGRSVGLDYHRIADLRGGFFSCFGIGSHLPAGGGNIVSLENTVNFGSGKVGFSVFAGGRHYFGSAGLVDVVKGLNFTDFTGSDVVVMNQRGHGAGRLTGQGKARHASVLQNFYNLCPLAPVGH